MVVPHKVSSEILAKAFDLIESAPDGSKILGQGVSNEAIAGAEASSTLFSQPSIEISFPDTDMAAWAASRFSGSLLRIALQLPHTRMWLN
jgi:hypothetical protein